MNITAHTQLCIVIGDPIDHTLSPVIHNAGYEALGIDNQFVYVACPVSPKDLSSCMEGVRALRIRGVSVTVPHKITIMQYLNEIDDVALKIGSVNTIVNHNGLLKGYNTDWIGTQAPLQAITPLIGKKVALIGAGGAARSVAYAVVQAGAVLSIYNRSQEKASALSQAFGGTVLGLDQIANIKDADIIINATTVGMEDNETPVYKEYLTQHHIVFDVIYNKQTTLLREAKAQGAKIIPGSEMLLHQGFAQFKLYTGHDAPQEAMKKALLQALPLNV